MQARIAAYGVALLSVLGALAVRGLADPWLGNSAATVFVYGAVAVAAWYGGFLPALAAAVAGYLGAIYLFIEPRGSISLPDARGLVQLLGYAISTLVIAALGGVAHAARRRAERGAAEAASSEERFRRFMEHSPALVFLKDEQGRYQYMNRAGEELAGVAPGAWTGKTDHDLLPAEVADRIRSNDRQVLERDEAMSFVLRYPAQGGERQFHSTKFPVRDAQGRRYVGAVTIDVTERMRIEEALREADRRKDDFLATLAHELRNPLAPMRSAVEILRRKGDADPQAQWSREVIARQVGQMSRLIDDLLDLARITSGKLTVRRANMPLSLAIEMARETSQPHVDAAGHRLVLQQPATPLYVDGDATRLAQVFANLLNNAARYTPRGGDIRLAVSEEAGMAVVRVSDSGIGFEPRDAAALFEPFVQSPRARGHAQGGLGIGLALARGIVALHGGSIDASSEGEARGSEFTVRLPLVQPVRAAAASRAGAAPFARALRVLIADDNRDNADSLARLLALGGHEVRVAYDGTSAIDLARAFRPSVAVLDIGMPGANGYHVARTLRGEFDRAIRLIALTGWGQESDRRNAADAGFDDHLTKPVEPDALEALLADVEKD